MFVDVTKIFSKKQKQTLVIVIRVAGLLHETAISGMEVQRKGFGLHTREHTHTHTHTHIHTHIHLHARMHARTHIHCTHITAIYLYIFKNTIMHVAG